MCACFRVLNYCQFQSLEKEHRSCWPFRISEYLTWDCFFKNCDLFFLKIWRYSKKSLKLFRKVHFALGYNHIMAWERCKLVAKAVGRRLRRKRGQDFDVGCNCISKNLHYVYIMLWTCSNVFKNPFDCDSDQCMCKLSISENLDLFRFCFEKEKQKFSTHQRLPIHNRNVPFSCLHLWKERREIRTPPQKMENKKLLCETSSTPMTMKWLIVFNLVVCE
jgi:hypothetical protein